MGISCGGFDMRRYRKPLIVAVAFLGLAGGWLFEVRRCENALYRSITIHFDTGNLKYDTIRA